MPRFLTAKAGKKLLPSLFVYSKKTKDMNILMLCNKSPYPPQEGGPMAMNSIVVGLLEAGHNVRILAVNSEKYHISLNDIPFEYRNKTRIELVDVDLRVKPVEAFKNLFSNESYHVKRFISSDFDKRLVEILEKEKFDNASDSVANDFIKAEKIVYTSIINYEGENVAIVDGVRYIIYRTSQGPTYGRHSMTEDEIELYLKKEVV